MAGTNVSDVIVTTDGLLSRHGYWAGCSTAHDTVRTVGLVGHTGVSPRTHHVEARLCARRRNHY